MDIATNEVGKVHAARHADVPRSNVNDESVSGQRDVLSLTLALGTSSCQVPETLSASVAAISMLQTWTFCSKLHPKAMRHSQPSQRINNNGHHQGSLQMEITLPYLGVMRSLYKCHVCVRVRDADMFRRRLFWGKGTPTKERKSQHLL